MIAINCIFFFTLLSYFYCSEGFLLASPYVRSSSILNAAKKKVEPEKDAVPVPVQEEKHVL